MKTLRVRNNTLDETINSFIKDNTNNDTDIAIYINDKPEGLIGINFDATSNYGFHKYLRHYNATLVVVKMTCFDYESLLSICLQYDSFVEEYNKLDKLGEKDPINKAIVVCKEYIPEIKEAYISFQNTPF